MSSKTLWAVVFLATAFAAVQAQEPTKVASKHYALAFENESVQVLNVHYGPHEKSPLHDHLGGVVVNITGGHLKFTDANGNAHEVFAKPGEARWFPPLKHSVENLGDTTCNAVYIGMKTKTGSTNFTPGHRQGGLSAETRKILAQYGLDSVPVAGAW